MGEQIVSIQEFSGKKDDYGTEAGFKIQTTEQVIVLAIDDDASCCESWGYFLTEDDTDKFIGTELTGISVTDTNRSSRKITTEWVAEADEGSITLDGGDVMFVDIETSRGVLQFVAYNAHNGYYGHEARISSKQLEHAKVL